MTENGERREGVGKMEKEREEERGREKQMEMKGIYLMTCCKSEIVCRTRPFIPKLYHCFDELPLPHQDDDSVTFRTTKPSSSNDYQPHSDLPKPLHQIPIPRLLAVSEIPLSLLSSKS